MNNGFGIRNELRQYRLERQYKLAERMDGIVARVCIVGLILYVILGVFA